MTTYWPVEQFGNLDYYEPDDPWKLSRIIEMPQREVLYEGMPHFCMRFVSRYQHPHLTYRKRREYALPILWNGGHRRWAENKSEPQTCATSASMPQ